MTPHLMAAAIVKAHTSTDLLGTRVIDPDKLVSAITRALQAASNEALTPYRWRPIAEIHEDCGSCVLMDIEDPGYLEIGSNLDTDFDESQWTHFAEVPKLSSEEGDELERRMGKTEAAEVDGHPV